MRILQVTPVLLSATATSPIPCHLLLGVIVLVIWPFIVRISKIAPQVPDNERKTFRLIMLAVMAATTIGFCGFLFNAFTHRGIAGYQQFEQWEWKTTLHGQEEIYTGEWPAFFFLYFFPVIATVAISYRLQASKRGHLWNVFIRYYPLIILCAYICFYLAAETLHLDISRAHSFSE